MFVVQIGRVEIGKKVPGTHRLEKKRRKEERLSFPKPKKQRKEEDARRGRIMYGKER